MWGTFIVLAIFFLIAVFGFYVMPIVWKISDWLSSRIKKGKKLKATMRFLKYAIVVTIGLFLIISFLNDSYLKQLEISISLLIPALFFCLLVMFDYKEKYKNSKEFAVELQENINEQKVTINELKERIFDMRKTIIEQEKLINKL